MDPVSGDAGLEASAIELSSGSIRKRQHGEISHDDEENAPSSKELRQMGQEGEEPPPDEVEGRGEAPVDFLIIGAQKAGTMAAVKNINKHPDVFVACEVHFFDLYWDMGLNWYRSHLRASKRLVGEKTPELIYVDECAVRMKEVCPKAKFILFLRDPVKRAYSSWNMQRARHLEDLSFSECVSRELGLDGGKGMLGEKRVFGTAEYHYVQKGFYFDQIQRFLQVFPDKSKLLIVIAERIQKNPTEEYNRIFRFLNAREHIFEAEDEHVGAYAGSMSKKVEKRLRDLYRPHNDKLFQFLGFRIDEWELG